MFEYWKLKLKIEMSKYWKLKCLNTENWKTIIIQNNGQVDI
jgi:hypothetical protein